MRNGKKVCNELKRVRKEIADANGIEYNPTECTHQGECQGTCPKCESEVKYIEKQLDLRRALGKAAIVAGLSLSVASCTGGADRQGDVPNDRVECTDSLIDTDMGDIVRPEDDSTDVVDGEEGIVDGKIELPEE